MRFLLSGAALAATLITGCSALQNDQLSIPTADALSVVAKAATCVAAVNAAATDPVCRAPVDPCRSAYDAGRAAVQAAQ